MMEEDGVTQGGVLGEDELVDELTGVPGGDELEVVAAAGLEGGDEVLGHVEGVVSEDGHGTGGSAVA